MAAKHQLTPCSRVASLVLLNRWQLYSNRCPCRFSSPQANREAPTVRFTSARNEVADAAASTAALVDGFTPNIEDPDGLEAQVAALLGAAGSLSAHAMAEADEALAPKVGGTGYF
jgi:hypothetical protein